MSQGLGFGKPQQSQVESRKVDPREVLKAAASPMDLSRLEPVKRDTATPPPEKQREQASAADIASRLQVTKASAPKAAAPRKTALDIAVTDQIVDQLSEELGLVSPVSKMFEVLVPVGASEIKIEFRRPESEDNIWAIGVVNSHADNDDRFVLTRTEAQWQLFTSQLVAMACVLKVHGQWVWDRLGQTEKIKELVPNWDGVSWRQVPLVIRSVMAQHLFTVFSRLHSELPYLVDEAVTKSLSLNLREKEGDDARPTKAI